MLLRHEHETLLTAGELLRGRTPREGRSLRIQACRCDPRQVRPGDMFVLLPDPVSAEAELLAAREAIARGCSVIASERPLTELSHLTLYGDEAPICLVPNARRAFGRALHALRGAPSSKIDLFAVVGRTDSEKRIIAHLLAHVLAQQGGAVGLDETLSVSNGDFWAPHDSRRPRTTEPEALVDRLVQMTDAQWSYGVLDVSHKAIDGECLAGVSLKGACLADAYDDSNRDDRRTPDGSKFHNLLDLLDDDGILIVDLDQPNARSLLPSSSRPVLTIGFSEDALVSAVPLECFPSEQTFLLCVGSDMIPVRTRIDRPEHIRDCMTAAAAGLAIGMELTAVVRGLESFESLAELEA